MIYLSKVIKVIKRNAPVDGKKVLSNMIIKFHFEFGKRPMWRLGNAPMPCNLFAIFEFFQDDLKKFKKEYMN